MTSDIVMPKLGLTMTEGILAEWKVQPGSTVRAGDTLFVVETEKVANDVAAERDGVIDALLIEAGASVAVGAPIARFRETTGGASAQPAKQNAQKPAGAGPKSAPASPVAPTMENRSADGRAIATPYARRLARERGIDLSQVRGSGPRGRIKAADVESAFSSATQAALAPVPVVGSAYYQFLLKIDCSRLIDLQHNIAQASPKMDVSIAAFVAMAAARAASSVSLDAAATQSDAMTITTRLGVATLMQAPTRRLGEIAVAIASAQPDSFRSSMSMISIVDLGLVAADFFAPPMGSALVTVGIGGVHSGHLGLSVAIQGDIRAGTAADLVDAIVRNLEQPWAMLA